MFEEALDTAFDGISIGITPFFHSFGYMQLILKIFGGKTSVVMRKFGPKTFLDAIVKYKVNIILYFHYKRKQYSNV